MEQITLNTKRLCLRPWSESDREPFAALNADPDVMEFFPAMLSRNESDASVDRIMAGFAKRGWGIWAVDVAENSAEAAEQRVSGSFIGFVGLGIPSFEAHFMPCVEIGWRLARHAWGHGYATEAATKVISFAFETLKLPEIVSFTSPLNVRSMRVMQRLNMTRDPAEDFDHPRIPEGHRIRRHVLYRLRNPFNAS